MRDSPYRPGKTESFGVRATGTSGEDPLAYPMPVLPILREAGCLRYRPEYCGWSHTARRRKSARSRLLQGQPRLGKANHRGTETTLQSQWTNRRLEETSNTERNERPAVMPEA